MVPAMLLAAATSDRAAAQVESCPLPPRTVLSKQEAPQGVDLTACEVHGRYIDLGRVTVPIPGPGTGVGTSVLAEDGETNALVTVEEDGTLAYRSTYIAATVIEPQDNDDSTVDPRVNLRTDGCDFSGSVPVVNYKVDSSGWGFHVGDGAQPAAGSQLDTATAASAAANTWRTQNSPCTAGDYTYVPAFTYLGTDSREGDFDTPTGGDTTCSDPDSASTIDAGNINPDTATAITCWWLRAQPGADTIITADIRLNTTDQDFTYTPLADSCDVEYDVRSTITHEMGHVLGLDDDYSGDAIYQTMSGTTKRCRKYKRTLGKGDVAGLLAHY